MAPCCYSEEIKKRILWLLTTKNSQFLGYLVPTLSVLNAQRLKQRCFLSNWLAEWKYKCKQSYIKLLIILIPKFKHNIRSWILVRLISKLWLCWTHPQNRVKLAVLPIVLIGDHIHADVLHLLGFDYPEANFVFILWPDSFEIFDS